MKIGVSVPSKNKEEFVNINMNLGIIAGEGALPLEMAVLYEKLGGKVFIAAIEGEADILSISCYQYKQFSIGLVGSLIEYFTKNNVKEIIMVGRVKRFNFKSIKVDSTGSSLITKILKEKFLGDNSILKVISNFIESKGFKVISPKKILELSHYNIFYNTNSLVSKQDQVDIKLGIKALNTLSRLDIGQSVIVSNSYILGIEAAEGTDNLIRRCKSLRKNNKGGVLIKIAKLFQDMRLDLPTIGPNTITQLAKYHYKGLAVKKSETIIVKQAEVISLLNEYNLFISYI